MMRSRLISFGIILLASSGAGCGAGDDGSTTNDDPSQTGPWNPVGTDAALPDGGSATRSDAGGSAGPTPGGGGTAGGGQPVGDAAVSEAGAGGSIGAGTPGDGGTSGTANPDASASVDAGPKAEAPVCMANVPDEFDLNTNIGGGGSQHKDSAHFALYGASNPDPVLNFMEAAHKCFIEDWCFRSPGLSVKADDSGPYNKTNIYSDAFMQAGGLTYWDANAGLAYIHILAAQIGDPRTTVHEYGHAITMSEYNWIDQKRTGFWWETVANWVAYSFLTSPYCEDARNEYSVKPATTIIDQMHTLTTVYNMSYTVICNDQNYYQAWPFLTYLTNNPDNYPGLGKMAVADLMRKYQINSNETPLHTLERIAAPVKVQTILGRYWARMAYMDIDLPVAQKDFLSSRGTLTFAANLDSSGGQTYTVKANRKPQYGGANITPLKVSGGGDVSVTVKNLGNGRSESNFTATLSIRSSSGAVRYVDLKDGAGQATVGGDEELSLVVVNTPDTLYEFDPQYIGSPENIGLNYQVEITGATPANN